MKAIVKTKKETGIDVMDMPRPEIGPTDILIRIAAGSVCGSDVHIYEWTPSYHFMPLPMIIGHEFSGIVEEVGSDISHVNEGDRITAIPSMACGHCDRCRIGRPGECKNRLGPGLSSNGYFADYGLLTSAADIFKIPENMSLDAAALLEPFSISLNAVDLSGFKMGEKIGVLGPGPIGLFVLQILRAGGAGAIIIAGAAGDEKRLELAKTLGADQIVDVTSDDPVKQARDMTRGGLDIVFEATGNPRAIPQALDMVRRGGKVVVIGIHSGPASFDPTPLVRLRKSIIGAYAYSPQTWQRSIELISRGIIDVEAVITHRIPLEDAEAGLELALQKKAVKVLLIP